MRLKLTLILLLFLGAFVLGAADLSGRWSGTIVVTDGADTVNLPILLMLKHDGDSLSGTAGADASHQDPITKAAVDGDKVSIEFTDGPDKYFLNLTANGDEMTGEAHTSDSPKMKITVKRSQG